MDHNPSIRRIESGDRTWVRRVTLEHWGDESVVAHSMVYSPHELEGWIAEDQRGNRTGLLTINVSDGAAEIVTLNSFPMSRGTGRALVAAARTHATDLGCTRLWLITTNDNLRATDFYLRQGFRLVAVHLDAMQASRAVKPSIPLIGAHGIPIRDELEFSLDLEGPCPEETDGEKR